MRWRASSSLARPAHAQTADPSWNGGERFFSHQLVEVILRKSGVPTLRQVQADGIDSTARGDDQPRPVRVFPAPA